jgi:hypothetical protein
MNAPRTARGPLGFIGAVFASGVSATLFAIALMRAETALVLIAYLTAIPLFIAGLGGGSLAGLVASLTGALGLYLVAPSNFAFVYTFVFAIPSIALTALALRYRIGADQKLYWYPEGYLLTAIAIYPCLFFLTVAGLMAGHEGGLLALTTEAFKTIADQFSKQLPADQAALVHAALQRLAKFAPAVVGCTWMVVTIIGMYIAQFLLQQHNWNLREKFSLTGLHVPHWLIYAVALTGLAGTLAPAPYDYFGKNLALILGLPFIFVGLAIVHAWAATTRAPTVLLVVFYVALTLFIWLALVVALLGVLDQWVDFRHRMTRPKPSV